MPNNTEPTDADYTAAPICPYCGVLYRYAKEWRMDDSDVIVACDGCERVYDIKVHMILSYSTRKVDDA